MKFPKTPVSGLRNRVRSWGHTLLCYLGAQFIRLCWMTGKWRFLGAWRPTLFWQSGQPFILCFWHGRLAMMSYCWPQTEPIHMLISAHADGRFIADTVKHFGIKTIPGSTAKGGIFALRQMISKLRAGDCVGITPDGPRGPRMRASMGAVTLARLSGVPLIPATYSVSRGRYAASWDRFLIPFPFSAGVMLWGEAIRVPEHADLRLQKQYCARLEHSLNRLTGRADHLMGRKRINPADGEETPLNSGKAGAG